MQNYGNKTLRELARDCKTVDEILEMMKSVFKETLQLVFEAEIEEHLGYEKHSSLGIRTGNSRNGYKKKTIKTKFGNTELHIPRDRNGEYEPQIVKNYETSINGLEEQILSLYSKGNSTRDIEDHIRDLYGVEVSPSLISKVTDKILPQVFEWQSRPLERTYPIVFLDAVHFKVREDHKVINKAAYTVLGINLEGQKDILGLWIGEHESASFWLSVCNDLKSRGVEDIFIICKDGLKGFSEAIETVFPRTNIQLCVIHQIRSSLKYIPSKLRSDFMNDLKKVYKAATYEEAENEFEKLKQNWSDRYPNVIDSWENNWTELTMFFSYPTEIRKLIYTTNTVEGFHRQLRKVTKTKSSFPTDNALRKLIYLATVEIVKKWAKPIPNWIECRGQFKILFGDRMRHID